MFNVEKGLAIVFGVFKFGSESGEGSDHVRMYCGEARAGVNEGGVEIGDGARREAGELMAEIVESCGKGVELFFSEGGGGSRGESKRYEYRGKHREERTSSGGGLDFC